MCQLPVQSQLCTYKVWRSSLYRPLLLASLRRLVGCYVWQFVDKLAPICLHLSENSQTITRSKRQTSATYADTKQNKQSAAEKPARLGGNLGKDCIPSLSSVRRQVGSLAWQTCSQLWSVFQAIPTLTGAPCLTKSSRVLCKVLQPGSGFWGRGLNVNHLSPLSCCLSRKA